MLILLVDYITTPQAWKRRPDWFSAMMYFSIASPSGLTFQANGICIHNILWYCKTNTDLNIFRYSKTNTDRVEVGSRNISPRHKILVLVFCSRGDISYYRTQVGICINLPWFSWEDMTLAFVVFASACYVAGHGQAALLQDAHRMDHLEKAHRVTVELFDQARRLTTDHLEEPWSHIWGNSRVLVIYHFRYGM